MVSQRQLSQKGKSSYQVYVLLMVVGLLLAVLTTAFTDHRVNPNASQVPVQPVLLDLA